ncbi:hypothetical protein PMI41_00545 [Phyllobacterium sp. YR531]|nr:hypothetical protein PMI41_00545 [Phyllobacterium sp. YR531]
MENTDGRGVKCTFDIIPKSGGPRIAALRSCVIYILFAISDRRILKNSTCPYRLRKYILYTDTPFPIRGIGVTLARPYFR